MSIRAHLAAVLLAFAGTVVAAPSFTVTLPASFKGGAQEGRLLVILAPAEQAPDKEPRELVNWGADAIPFYGLDVEGWRPGSTRVVDAEAFGFPVMSLRDLPAGRYRVQALLNRYEAFRMGDGRVLKLPPDRGEGQQWRSKPGNLYSRPIEVRVDPKQGGTINLVLDEEIPAVQPFVETPYVKHVRVRSERLSKFWGRDVGLSGFLCDRAILPAGGMLWRSRKRLSTSC